jgi:hypothetical protein
MSRTKHTTSLKYLVSDDVIEEIKIIEKSTGKYDLHLLHKSLLKNILRNINPKYLFGLKAIELRQKRNSPYANKLGSYSPTEKIIKIYSIEVSPIFPKLPKDWIKSIESFQGEIIEFPNFKRIKWQKQGHAVLWYINFVLCHELGHHYVNMSKFRRKQTYKPAIAEIRANYWAKVIFEEYLENLLRE